MLMSNKMAHGILERARKREAQATSKKKAFAGAPWFHYVGKLRPQFPTIIHEIQADDGTPLVRWGGFDGVDGSHRKITAYARVMAAGAEMLDALREALPLLEAIQDGNVAKDVALRKTRDAIFKAEHGPDLKPDFGT